MSDDLLSYYSRELTYIRELAAEFARSHPAVAERLGIPRQADEAKDPHVERMIEAFAYLTGRIRRKLDDDFPELVNGMMGVLYPHYSAPVPSMGIAQVKLQRSQAGLLAGHHVPAGEQIETPVTAGPNAGEICRFRTCYPVSVWPVEVAAARLGGLPFSSTADRPAQAIATLQIELKGFTPEVSFSKLQSPVFRFFLNGQDQHTLPLYELIFNHSLQLVVKESANDRNPIVLPPSAIREVGFGRDEGLLPYPARAFPGYRLLTEYFAFPRKFLFFEIALPPNAMARYGNRAELCLYLSRSNTDLEKVVSAETFRLGCTPIVNLFQRQADGVELDETRTEYRIEPDRRRRAAHEIYSVDKVTVAARESRAVEYRPFYSFTHETDGARQDAFWYARRRPPRRDDSRIDRGTEVFLTLVDLNFERLALADRTLITEVTCLNRDLPQELPWGGGQPQLTLIKGGPVVLECLTQPTATLRGDSERGGMWRLVSHLSLNHLSLSGGPEAAAALREVLRLYNFSDAVDIDSKIAAILDVRSRLVIGRAGGVAAGGACRGLEITVHFDEDRFSDRGLYLFASILERFLALYCSINSFSQLVVTTKQREGMVKRWRPRAGDQVLL